MRVRLPGDGYAADEDSNAAPGTAGGGGAAGTSASGRGSAEAGGERAAAEGLTKLTYCLECDPALFRHSSLRGSQRDWPR